MFSRREGKKIRRTFARKAEAERWRADARADVSRGALRMPTPTTIAQAWERWHEDAAVGIVRNRSGDPLSRPPCAPTPARYDGRLAPSSGPFGSPTCSVPICSASPTAYSPGG